MGSLIILLCCCPDLCFVTRKLASFKLIGIEFEERRVMAHSFSVKGSSLRQKLRGCHKVMIVIPALYTKQQIGHRHTPNCSLCSETYCFEAKPAKRSYSLVHHFLPHLVSSNYSYFLETSLLSFCIVYTAYS